MIITDIVPSRARLNSERYDIVDVLLPSLLTMSLLLRLRPVMTQAQVILPLPALRDSNSSDEEDEEEVNEPESLPDHNFDIKKSVWKSGPKKGEEKVQVSLIIENHTFMLLSLVILVKQRKPLYLPFKTVGTLRHLLHE